MAFLRRECLLSDRWNSSQSAGKYGIRTQILEFIDMEHTPKNLLIRAVKTGNKKKMKIAESL